MESLRFVTLTASEHDWIRDIRRGFIVPGGKYFLVFVSDGVYTLSLEELSGTPVSFISLQDVNLEGLDVRPRRWTTGRPDDGSLTFYAAIRPADRTVHTETYAFWSGNFQGPMPTQTYYGQFTILGSPRNTGGLEDFCLLPNGRFLVIDFAGHSLSLFPHPEFQTVDHLNQPLPMEYTTPLWQYQYPLGDGHLRGCGCCYRVAMGSEGPKILGHQMLPDGSRFLPGRTGALVATPLDGEDGLRIGCLRYAPETEWKSDSPQSYATFDVSTANLPGWASDTRPSRCLNSGQIHFNEEGGRICILSKDTSLFRQEATVFVLDVI
ncbi:hypothetical protein M407DRAFT_30544 [Tulasnella calospora MUT 4182]|uniref:Uncharacterized protein n=1 Tax=Tulasnella calospora MUT 4182 TaxID=1051891 RepID=A0A0C3KEB9_9AGAM|nr:hypothetical protein M407DRAFT_30544 [Tulasnella calospora MUT 4182]